MPSGGEADGGAGANDGVGDQPGTEPRRTIPPALARRLRPVDRFSGPDPATFASSALWDPVTEIPAESERWLPAAGGAIPATPDPVASEPGSPPAQAPVQPAAQAPVQGGSERAPRPTNRPTDDELEGWPDFDEPARV